MKILFLLPPSEGKNKSPLLASPQGRGMDLESLSFILDKPLHIAQNVIEKDLKCSGKRFEEGLELNKELCSRVGLQSYPTLEAINRYSGVMFNAIDYSGMNKQGKDFFENQFLILSGMYGMLKPLDTIGNYKLPIESKGLLDFWRDKIVREINNLKIDYIINLLPISYSKLILGKNKKLGEKFNKLRNFGVININFLKPDGKKISHGVKKVKGEWIKNICEKNINNYKNFGGEIIEAEEGIIDINIINK